MSNCHRCGFAGGLGIDASTVSGAVVTANGSKRVNISLGLERAILPQ